MSRNKSIAAVLVAVCAASALSGCQSDVKRRHTMIRRNPTPELKTLADRKVDQDNSWTIMKDENLRMISMDINRFFYIDRPSRLTREPIPRP